MNNKKNRISAEKVNWNKKDLTNIISEKLNIPKSQALEYLNAIVETISEGLIQGKKITISDFGSISVSERKSFQGTHPQTGEPLEVTARFIPVFKVGKKLRAALNPHLSDKDE
tara:strand:- start:1584 stop:1922 length:339 start_codon:yes stop_codon:yes gene_type:complete